MKTCYKCKQELELTSFAKDSSRKDGLQNKCKDCQKKLSALHYIDNRAIYVNRNITNKNKTKEMIRAGKCKPCADCGISYPYWIMQYDHLKDKSFTISQSSNYTNKEIEAEILKCEVVCGNCHLHRTFLAKDSPKVQQFKDILKTDISQSP